MKSAWFGLLAAISLFSAQPAAAVSFTAEDLSGGAFAANGDAQGQQGSDSQGQDSSGSGGTPAEAALIPTTTGITGSPTITLGDTDTFTAFVIPSPSSPSRAQVRSRCPNPTADNETLLLFSSPNAQAGHPSRRFVLFSSPNARTGHP